MAGVIVFFFILSHCAYSQPDPCNGDIDVPLADSLIFTLNSQACVTVSWDLTPGNLCGPGPGPDLCCTAPTPDLLCTNEIPIYDENGYKIWNIGERDGLYRGCPYQRGAASQCLPPGNYTISPDISCTYFTASSTITLSASCSPPNCCP